jgi:hypothetical protein
MMDMRRQGFALDCEGPFNTRFEGESCSDSDTAAESGQALFGIKR